ncbi:hypothetical protein JHK85_017779 [Glycine max]|uniref:sister chromatid cohesion protein PDS5-like n=1 Tax=Glycine max TaxID=3847 RepID=UPI0007192E96|nr:sister chromatid cohesion protein PDS5-like [Glycine max]XP_028240675.1 sister chromatid cohesion protein PDS5-like [Glycine soja]KAG5008768.1 hypothetical protein JHK87_017283 [Glycine soja]KAG5021437.1 hypothetical protein JHK85_017779 [Glycine max]KAG5036551.1 hypothetical protein JHK86_017391 [Glycine max]|eukprot:XP_014632862.1 sister chromatid cohesion protein PDS5-like [Glycine max]
MPNPDESERNAAARKLGRVGEKLLKNSSLLLSTLGQELTEPIQESLVSSKKALISIKLLRLTDEDVKISVTSCLIEITRITDVPYDDGQMKEIFKLIVASFEKFSHISGHEKALDIPGY